MATSFNAYDAGSTVPSHSAHRPYAILRPWTGTVRGSCLDGNSLPLNTTTFAPTIVRGVGRAGVEQTRSSLTVTFIYADRILGRRHLATPESRNRHCGALVRRSVNDTVRPAQCLYFDGTYLWASLESPFLATQSQRHGVDTSRLPNSQRWRTGRRRLVLECSRQSPRHYRASSCTALAHVTPGVHGSNITHSSTTDPNFLGGMQLVVRRQLGSNIYPHGLRASADFVTLGDFALSACNQL